MKIYVARGDHVRCIALTPRLGVLASLAALVLAAWLIGATSYALFHKEIREAAHFYHIEKQRSYEDRIATLRRQIDTINSRQFLDQVAFERRLSQLRQRQNELEERQAQLSGVLETGAKHDFSFLIAPGESGERRYAADEGIITGSVASAAPLSTRPQPSGAVRRSSSARDAADPASQALGKVEGSIETLVRRQNRILATLESELTRTVEQLAAVPKAIGATLPDFEDEAGGIGGPFVELRGTDQPLAIEDQISRIERTMARVSKLKRHVRRLPVRVPLKENARITSGFGSRMDPFLGRRAMHSGIDFRASTGTPVISTGDGRVVRAGRLGGYGNLVEIDHGAGYTTRYAHLSGISVKRGQEIEAGQVIGSAGSTGRSTGPHLHYETRIKGRAVDPTPFVKAAEILPNGF